MPTSFTVETGLLTLAYKTPPGESLPPPDLHPTSPHSFCPRVTGPRAGSRTPYLRASAPTALLACSWLCRAPTAAWIASALQCAGCSLGFPCAACVPACTGSAAAVPGSGAQAHRRGAQASLLRGTWDLPSPGSRPVSPALAGGSLTTGPPAALPRLAALPETLFRSHTQGPSCTASGLCSKAAVRGPPSTRFSNSTRVPTAHRVLGLCSPHLRGI